HRQVERPFRHPPRHAALDRELLPGDRARRPRRAAQRLRALLFVGGRHELRPLHRRRPRRRRRLGRRRPPARPGARHVPPRRPPPPPPRAAAAARPPPRPPPPAPPPPPPPPRRSPPPPPVPVLVLVPAPRGRSGQRPVRRAQGPAQGDRRRARRARLHRVLGR